MGSSQTCVSSLSLQSMVTIQDGKMVHVQKWDGKETTLVREVNGNNLTLVSAPQQRSHVSTSTFDVILFR